MSAIFITSFLLLVAIAFAIYRWQHPSSNKNTEHALPPSHYSGLFSDDDLPAMPQAIANSEIEVSRSEQRTALLARAAAGDKEMLWDAHATGDEALYDEVLDALVEQASSSVESLNALVSYIARSDKLRANAKLAEAQTKLWKALPDKCSTPAMLHTAALTHDARIYQQAVEVALRFWREGRLPDLSANELRALIESEYWILAPSARSSGAGFVLKRTLAAFRRELQAATNSKW